MVSMLDRKLARDFGHLRGQVAAISLVVACGVAIVMSMRTSYRSLLESRDAYYADYRLADVFAHLKRAPESLRDRIAAIPGVAEVDTRIQVEITLDVPGLAEPATGRLVSIPDQGQASLNRLHLRRGTWPERGRGHEVLVSEAFASANGLDVGDRLGGVINGRWQRLLVVGIALSPEYVYEIGAGMMFPDNRRFGLMWGNREVVAAAFDLVGAFNDLSLRLAPGASEAAVIARLDPLLETYGGLGAYGRDEQISARFLQDEINQARNSGTVVPAIFLGTAAFLLHIVLARFIGRERHQIAVLKAFGYSNWAVGRHYAKLAFAALLFGAFGGIGLGLWFAQSLNRQYAEFYRFPSFAFRVDYSALAIALLVTVAAAMAGAAGAVRHAVRLMPAAAMQPESPEQFRRALVERLGLQRFLASSTRIILRNLERRPIKAALSVLGIAFATAILVIGSFFLDAMTFMADVQFRHVQRENLAIVFTNPLSAGVRYELGRLPGVLQVEPFRAAPVRIRSGHRNRRIELMGLESGGELRRVVGADLIPVPIPVEGIVLTGKLAEILDCGVGDTVTIQMLDGERDVYQRPVTATVNELLGLNGYMDQRALNRMLEEGNSLSGAFIRTDSSRQTELLSRLKELPAVAGVTSRDAALTGFRSTLDENVRLITSILILFAGALAVAMVYNTARIALAEQSRELASLRVLGFSRGEVARMLLGEQAIITISGILLGLWLGHGFSALLTGLYQWEMFRVPLVITGRTYASAALVILGAAVISGSLVRRQLNRADLVAVLKTRE